MLRVIDPTSEHGPFENPWLPGQTWYIRPITYAPYRRHVKARKRPMAEGMLRAAMQQDLSALEEAIKDKGSTARMLKEMGLQEDDVVEMLLGDRVDAEGAALLVAKVDPLTGVDDDGNEIQIPDEDLSEALREAFEAYPAVANWVVTCAEEQERRFRELAETVSGNSEPSSGGARTGGQKAPSPRSSSGDDAGSTESSETSSKTES